MNLRRSFCYLIWREFGFEGIFVFVGLDIDIWTFLGVCFFDLDVNKR